MYADFLYRVFAEAGGRDAVIHRERTTSYAGLLDSCRSGEEWLSRNQVGSGTVVALRGDYSAESISLLLALIQRNAIVLMTGLAAGPRLEKLMSLGEAEVAIEVSGGGPPRCERTGVAASHPLYQKLRGADHPGLVLFSSGSTGESKGTLHDLSLFLRKYHRRRHDLRTLAFLLFDHIGGIDTLFYCLSNGSAIVTVEQRDPASVCSAVDRHRVQVLPVAPAFLNMLYFSKEYERHDLSSLLHVTYGAEVMPEATLRYCREMFPKANLLQKYGASEIGTPRSQSKSPDSLWVKIGGEGYQWRVVNGMLEIKAEGAMLGYLNAPSPFTEDGWFRTGDCVEVDGEYLRFLGRDSDLINVGGKKVYPAEVENALKELAEVMEVTVKGEPNPLLGQVVAATVWPAPGADETALRVRIKQHAATRLEPYKIPARIQFANGDSHSTSRFKKLRRQE